MESQHQGQEVTWLDTHLRGHMHANDRERIITSAGERPVAETCADRAAMSLPSKTSPLAHANLFFPGVKLAAHEKETCYQRFYSCYCRRHIASADP